MSEAERSNTHICLMETLFVKKVHSSDKKDGELLKQVKMGDYVINLMWHNRDGESIVLKNIIERVLGCIGQELSMRLNSKIRRTTPQKDLTVICCSKSNFNRYTDSQFERELKDTPYTALCVPDQQGNLGIFVLLQDEYDYYKDSMGLDSFAFAIAFIFIKSMYEAIFPSRKRSAEKFASGFGRLLVDCIAQNVWSEAIYNKEYDNARNSKN